MGFPKPWLPFGPTRLLTRIVGTLWDATYPVVVVRASAEQSLPPLAPEIELVEDEQPGAGPLAALATGLRAIGALADAVFVTSCDAPHVTSAYIDWLAARLGSHQAVIPFGGGHHHCLAALYRQPQVLGKIDELLTRGERQLKALPGVLDVRRVESNEMREIDPQALIPRTMNTPADFAAALEAAGLPVVSVPSEPPE
jgi:molybdopterin-guanine dinucleotide biosynthesis protein A